MIKRWSCRACLAVMTMIFVLPGLGRAQTVPPEATEEAMKILGAWVEKSKADPSWFRHKWRLDDSETDFSQAKLEKPYVLYLMHPSHFVDYLHSPESDIVSSAQLLDYGYPVVNEGEYIGSLLVDHNRGADGKKIIEEKGEYMVAGRHMANSKLDLRILELRTQYTEEEGYVVCGLTTSVAGQFVLIRRAGRTEFIAPCDPFSAGVLSPVWELGVVKDTKSGRYPVFPFDQAVPSLREVAEEARVLLEPDSVKGRE